jgi:hypothetical protein
MGRAEAFKVPAAPLIEQTKRSWNPAADHPPSKAVEKASHHKFG